MTLLDVTHLRVAYGDRDGERVAVDDVSFGVAPGEIEQRDERMFNLWRGGAKVRVGGDQAGRRQHAPFNLARRVPLYKGRHRF